MRYGNGTETDYQYNAVTRQAKRMELYTSENNSTGGQIKILDKSYQYNALGMISSIANSAGHLGTSLAYNDLGGSYSFNYTYDDHGRLSSVGNSSWTGSGGTWTYNLSMTYAKDGRILSKDQGFVGPAGTPHATMDYALSYQYGASADVHQLTKIVEDGFDINVTYNARGGIKHIDNKKTKELTTHVWDQDMRLRGTKNNGGLHHNVYDWTGTRLMKSTLTSATVYQNGNPTTTYSVMPYIVYAGSHYVFEMYRNDVEVSKHYFAGDERIATRLQVETRVSSTYSEPTEYTSYFGSFDPDGDGTFNPNPAPATPNNIVLEDLCRMASSLGYPLECYFLNQQLLPQYTYSVGDRDACWGEGEFNAFVFPMDMTAYCECLDPNQPNRSYDCTLYPFIYWYHHDHKGSTEFVTDLAGMAYEYSLYSPFGEALVSQSANNSGYSNPYKFKGAIYDPETGLTYNVARFYNAKWSIWISPDPLAHLRNWVTPYNYTLNNPINRIDPTGLLCKEVKTGPGDPPMDECEDEKKGVIVLWEVDVWGDVYSSGIRIAQAAESAGQVPYGESHASESFMVGDYTLLPNYILRNGTPILSHYTASIPIKVFNEYGCLQTIQRIDYVLGKDDLQEFKDNITLFSTAALLLFGASEKLSPGIIEMLNGNQVSGSFRYLIEEWTNPGNIITALNMFVIGLPRTGLSGSKGASMVKSARRAATAAKGVTAPKGWITVASKKGGGTVFKDPSNPHNIIRQMPGNPNSPNVLQQSPYLKFMKEGKFYDVNGKVLPNGNVPQSHIPLNQFNINNMPKL